MANWAKEYAEQLPKAPVPAEVKTAEFDEIFTYIGDKKIEFISDREMRCILGWKVTWERSHAIVDDALDVYASL